MKPVSNFTFTTVSEVKEGSYVLVDDEPCKISSISKSKPGKHGSAKARIIAKGVFDGRRRTIVKRVDERIKEPLIRKRRGQIINVRGSRIQLMDQETYETRETSMPKEEGIKKKIEVGKDVEYWVISGKIKIMSLHS